MGSRAWLWGLVPPLLAGAGLRGFRLREQILIGDELHAVNAAVARPVGEIVTQWTYHGADYCVPLAALYRLLLDAGVQLSELGFRAPVLAASLLLVVAVPLALRPRLGRRACLVLAWLLALSPMLVLYGRMVRSYAPAVLLAFAAVVTFDRWWRDRSRGAAAAYAALAAGAVYFHLGAAPLVGAPILYAVLETLVDRRGAPAAERARALLPLAVPLAGLTVLLAALLLPARQSLVELAGLHGDGALPDPATWLDVARLQLGTSAFSLVAVAVGVAARGAWILYRRDARFGLYLLTLAAVHTGWLLLFAPHLFQHLLVVNRYFLLLLPFLLALLALGLASPWTSRPSRVARIAQDAGVAGRGSLVPRDRQDPLHESRRSADGGAPGARSGQLRQLLAAQGDPGHAAGVRTADPPPVRPGGRGDLRQPPLPEILRPRHPVQPAECTHPPGPGRTRKFLQFRPRADKIAPR